jgi:ParB/RepB/Spo0J family partition protein
MDSNSNRPIEEIWSNPENPRRDIRSDPNFEGLVSSVASEGILQPLLINGEGMILAGHRRYEAALVVGLETVPVHLVSDQNTHALVPLIENLQRRDLAVLEVADYVCLCHREFGMSIDSIADATGISKSTLNKYLRLAEGPKEIRERVERDEIPLNAAYELLRHDDEFIREVVKTPHLTKQIVRERAAERETELDEPSRRPVSTLQPKQQCPTGRVAHLKFAINAVRELLAASPDDAFSVRYRRWLVVMEDDLADTFEAEPSYRNTIASFQRQPKPDTRRNHGSSTAGS